MKKSKCFVLDTNVIVSGILFPNSVPALAIKKAFNTGKVIVSEETMKELTRILSDNRFDKYVSFAKRQVFLLNFENVSEIVEHIDNVKLSRDPNDDKFLSLANSGKASAIITGDSDLLTLHPFGKIQIITPVEFLEKF
ncbi:MAG: putative toxin-antitoxin system toxin component, PIN family [Chitinophagaceae bacterium]|nr:MAG: putative toxin-antitoxin system toxin component, PIN family [Chitinophagaceae bacterium]